MTTRDVARRFSGHVAAMDFAGAFDMLHDDAHYTVIGMTPISGTIIGKGEVIAKLGAIFATFVELPRIIFEEPVVEGDRAVLLATGKGIGPHGPYEQPYYAFVVTVSGERISRVIEFMDTGMLETAVFGRKPMDA